MKNRMFLLWCILLLMSCSHKDTDTNQIVGQWLLKEAKVYGVENGVSPSFTLDYSNQSILYDFRENGELWVTSGDHPEMARSTGEYEYFYGKDYLGGEGDGAKVLLVKINDSKFTYKLSEDGEMTLGKSYVDGPDLIFRRR